MGDSKAALKIYTTQTEKNQKKASKDPYAKILSQIVRASIISAGGKIREANEELESAFNSLLEACGNVANIKLKELMETCA